MATTQMGRWRMHQLIPSQMHRFPQMIPTEMHTDPHSNTHGPCTNPYTNVNVHHPAIPYTESHLYCQFTFSSMNTSVKRKIRVFSKKKKNERSKTKKRKEKIVLKHLHLIMQKQKSSSPRFTEWTMCIMNTADSWC